jgi:hypothetical protein
MRSCAGGYHVRNLGQWNPHYPPYWKAKIAIDELCGTMAPSFGQIITGLWQLHLNILQIMLHIIPHTQPLLGPVTRSSVNLGTERNVAPQLLEFRYKHDTAKMVSSLWIRKDTDNGYIRRYPCKLKNGGIAGCDYSSEYAWFSLSWGYVSICPPPVTTKLVCLGVN